MICKDNGEVKSGQLDSQQKVGRHWDWLGGIGVGTGKSFLLTLNSLEPEGRFGRTISALFDYPEGQLVEPVDTGYLSHLVFLEKVHQALVLFGIVVHN